MSDDLLTYPNCHTLEVAQFILALPLTYAPVQFAKQLAQFSLRATLTYKTHFIKLRYTDRCTMIHNLNRSDISIK